MSIQVTAVSIPSSAQQGSLVPVSIALKSLVVPATMYAMRARALYTKYPYDGTAPTTITLLPTSEVNDVLGEEQVFTGTFLMPAWSVTVQFAIESQATPTSAWVTVSYESGIVTVTSVAPAQFDMSTMMNMIMMLMMMVMMVKVMGGITA